MNWIRWSRRSRFIPTHCWLKHWPLRLIHWKSCSFRQWMDKNKNLQGKALADAVAKQPWDPSVQSIGRISRRGAADGRQYSMDDGSGKRVSGAAIGRDGRSPAHARKGSGHRESQDQRAIESGDQNSRKAGKQVIEVEQANPDVVYVPSYDPTVVYGPAPACISLLSLYLSRIPAGDGSGVGAESAGSPLGALGPAHWGNCDWNNGNVNINNNNNFNRNNNQQHQPSTINRGQARVSWQHNPQHRGNAPYG